MPNVCPGRDIIFIILSGTRYSLIPGRKHYFYLQKLFDSLEINCQCLLTDKQEYKTSSENYLLIVFKVLLARQMRMVTDLGLLISSMKEEQDLP